MADTLLECRSDTPQFAAHFVGCYYNTGSNKKC